MEEMLYLGKYSLPYVLTFLLAFVFSMWVTEANPAGLSNRYKRIIAAGSGIGLGLLALYYQVYTPGNTVQVIFPVVVDHVLYGFNLGLSAIGANELVKGAR
jgi:hypothetical protein